MCTLSHKQRKTKEVSDWTAVSTRIKIYNHKKFWIMHILVKRKRRRATVTNRRLSPVLTSGGYGQWQTDRIVGRVTQESWGLSSDASKWQRRDTQNNIAIWQKKAVEPPYNVPHMNINLTSSQWCSIHLKIEVIYINPLVPKDRFIQHAVDAEKTERHLKSLAKNMQSNGWPLKPCVFCRIHRALNSGTKGLKQQSYSKHFHSCLHILFLHWHSNKNLLLKEIL